MPMTNAKRISTLAGAVFLCTTVTVAAAATGEFDNMCVEGLALGQDIRTNCSVNTVFKGKTYCFGNDQAKEVFLKNPEGNLAKAETYYASKRR
jgi:YHS domain-containing protein